MQQHEQISLFIQTKLFQVLKNLKFYSSKVDFKLIF